MIVVALIGAPGAGKSSLAIALAAAGVPRIRVSGGGTTARRNAADGLLASDSVAIASILDQLRLAIAMGHSAVTLDGFPRTARQASTLLEWSHGHGCTVRPVIFDVPTPVLDARLAARLTTECRPDDAPEVLKARRREYELRLAPLLRSLHGVAPALRLAADSAEDVLERVRESILDWSDSPRLHIE